jgi:hypothetical protein
VVRADRVEDELAARVVQLGCDESLCLLLGEVAANDGERLLGARRPVTPDDRAFDSDVPVRKGLLLNAEADDARRLDQLGLARPPTLGPGEECVVNTTPSDSPLPQMAPGTSQDSYLSLATRNMPQRFSCGGPVAPHDRTSIARQV